MFQSKHPSCHSVTQSEAWTAHWQIEAWNKSRSAGRPSRSNYKLLSCNATNSMYVILSIKHQQDLPATMSTGQGPEQDHPATTSIHIECLQCCCLAARLCPDTLHRKGLSTLHTRCDATRRDATRFFRISLLLFVYASDCFVERRDANRRCLYF